MPCSCQCCYLHCLESVNMAINTCNSMQSGDDELLVSASEDTSVRLWLPSSDNAAEQQKLPHKDQVTHLPSSGQQIRLYGLPSHSIAAQEISKIAFTLSPGGHPL